MIQVIKVIPRKYHQRSAVAMGVASGCWLFFEEMCSHSVLSLFW